MKQFKKPIEKGSRFVANNILYEIKWNGTMTDREKEKHKLVAFCVLGQRTLVMDEETFRNTFKGIWS